MDAEEVRQVSVKVGVAVSELREVGREKAGGKEGDMGGLQIKLLQIFHSSNKIQ